jgi:phytoene synthase
MLITKRYSTSFSMGIQVFSTDLREPIYSIYGFVRFADEIVDTFHEYDKKYLLEKFKADTYEAISSGISLNPVLHSFQAVVRKYNIDLHLIESFLKSMEMDLYFHTYEDSLYEEYIYGSAEVVGLMCLRVFCPGNEEEYQRLAPFAKSLGAAFQKVNFLRDIKSDYDIRSRIYFPGMDFESFSDENKRSIEADIQKDFDNAYIGIKSLPKSCRLGVYLAFKYYTSLFNKIKQVPCSAILNERIRVADSKKVYFLFSSAVRNQLGLI